MSTEVALRESRAHQRNPANVLYAVEYGDMLGLAPMAAITGVHVIEGRPTASAGLISALVRRAGHRLRVTGDAKAATVQIIRSDDPEYTFEVTWTLEDAKTAGLLGKSVWKNYPGSMLKSRAITQCARDACEEALFGLHYTAEDLGAEVNADGDPLASTAPAVQPAADPWATAPASVPAPEPAPEPAATDPEWLADALKRAGEVTEDTYKKLWGEVGVKVRDGICTAADADTIQETIRARMDEVRADGSEPVDAEIVLDPSDPWAAKADEITTAGEGQQALDEVADLVARGTLDVDYGRAVSALIRARMDALAGQVAA